ncbi:sulfurtransferase [Marinilongibacter aquaticus]|uniref:sulfurtransferase n=1 Tax=Marinilongibacter aquaticus TaxID=2975157 RepID=UPI0021BDC4C2|nr:sulfurtransferase [Marinilongibacter aquaticus]UBM60183.1 sulfurtransferase [Marinilongibacter aquaticus]
MSDTYNIQGPLVDVDWLRDNFNKANVKIVEAKMKPVNAPDNWETGFKIPGAVQMDINADFSILETDLPHMFPDAALFSKSAQKLGLHNEDVLVVYDQVGTYGSPRAWWMFRAMGHEKVYVLNGGLPAWQKAEMPLEKAEWPKAIEGDFVAQINKALWKTADEVLSEIGNENSQILDARAQGRFDGTAPEPRPDLRGGHIPGSFCLPFQQVQDGIYMKSEAQLKAIFSALNLGEKSLIMSCGSGVTASVLALAAEVAGYKNAAVYDGSWAEWGMPNEKYPVEKA